MRISLVVTTIFEESSVERNENKMVAVFSSYGRLTREQSVEMLTFNLFLYSFLAHESFCILFRRRRRRRRRCRRRFFAPMCETSTAQHSTTRRKWAKTQAQPAVVALHKCTQTHLATLPTRQRCQERRHFACLSVLLFCCFVHKHLAYHLARSYEIYLLLEKQAICRRSSSGLQNACVCLACGSRLLHANCYRV